MLPPETSMREKVETILLRDSRLPTITMITRSASWRILPTFLRPLSASLSLSSLSSAFVLLTCFSLSSIHPSFLVSAQQLQSDVIKVGGLFTETEKDGPTELAFKYAVYRINKDRNILPNATLLYDIQYVSRDDSFHAAKRACHQISNGVVAIFGPQDPLLGIHVQSLCDAVDVPHIESRQQHLGESSLTKEFSINLHPGSKEVSDSLRGLINYLNWTKVAVIYEDDMSLIGLQELVKPPAIPKNVQFVFRKSSSASFRETLQDLKGRNIYSMIVDIRPDSLPNFLTAVLQVQMNDYKYHYHFTTYDIEVFDLENFMYNFVNMTAFRIVDSTSPYVGDIERFSFKGGRQLLNKTNVIQAGPALMFDSVYALAKGIHALQKSAPRPLLRSPNASCETEEPWMDGSSLYNYINSVQFAGLTGKVQFKEGTRTNIKWDLLKLRRKKLDKVGEWTDTSGLNITNPTAFHEFGTMNITLKVTTIESHPYVMKKKHHHNSSDAKEIYEGFCIDLLQTIAESLGFHFDLYIVPDGKFGVEDSQGSWNGMVRELMDRRADLAVAPMTITYNRESVIDFTKPFMNLGIGILFKIPTTMPTRLFSFMSPLAVDIWVYVLAAYIVVSATLFIVARFSPYEWVNPHPCVVESSVVENQFSLANSFWFTVVTLMKQGCDLNPKAVSTRIIGAIWWFFTLILISSYTANLAAFLTVERMITPIESVEDLAVQSKISYGALEAGSTMTFFRDSKIPTYQKMWKYMETYADQVLAKNYEDGVARVLEGNYAFLMESTMLDYMVQRNCNLTQVGGLLDSKGYGIATPMGSPWRDRISLAILDLQEKGIVQMLYDKWWKSPGLTCIRDEIKNKDGKASALGLDNIGGVFVVLLFGLAFAVLTAVGEFVWFAKRSRSTSSLSFNYCNEMREEFKYAVKCGSSKQRPVLRRECSRCLADDSASTTGAPYVPSIRHGSNPLSVIGNNISHGLYHQSHPDFATPTCDHIHSTLLPVTEDNDDPLSSSRLRHHHHHEHHHHGTNKGGRSVGYFDNPEKDHHHHQVIHGDHEGRHQQHKHSPSHLRDRICPTNSSGGNIYPDNSRLAIPPPPPAPHSHGPPIPPPIPSCSSTSSPPGSPPPGQNDFDCEHIHR